jgi:alcohol dehydrogenase, propanol-preferring
MRAWEVGAPGPIDRGSLRMVTRNPPTPGRKQILIRVLACGVCRTDLHVIERDLPPHRVHVVPGHEIVGSVEESGLKCVRFRPGARVGIAWLRSTCQTCQFCRSGSENLCVSPRFTGWDEDGGYAEYAVVDEDYAYQIPDAFDDLHAAPLLCAGIIGYRALKRAAVPAGGAIGIYGFGGSAHLATQIALGQGARVHVMTRSRGAQELAKAIGAHSVAGTFDPPPEALDSAIIFAPAGEIVPHAMDALRPGGRVAIAGIHLSDVPPLNYERHLFYEKELVSVTANTRADGREFLDIAARIPIQVTVQKFGLDEADLALTALARDEITGAAVLVP